MEEPQVSPARLARILDEMALLYHDVPVGAPSGMEATPPARDYERTRRALESRFPELGYYGMADPLDLLPKRPMTGDAIDDLTDIVGEVEEVIWRWDALARMMPAGISGSCTKFTGDAICTT